MKAIFFSINLVFAVAGLVLGLATCWFALGATHSLAAAIVGLGTLVLAAFCFCMCGGCLSHRRQYRA